MGGLGFDIRSDVAVFTDGEKVVLVDPGGRKRQVSVPGLYQIVRPSFSPDGKRVAVQATDSPPGPSEDLNIYVIDLETGEAQRISFLAVNEESPEWFPTDDRIVYSSFDPQKGISAHVYDLNAGAEVLAFDGGGIHLAVSPDGRLIFNPQLVRMYDATTGELVADLRIKVLAALDAQGYQLDERYAGQAGRGTFPLNADFSPDGQRIVLDGAVQRDGIFGIVLFSMTIQGNDLTPLTGLIEVDPAQTNFNNFSHLNPVWK